MSSYNNTNDDSSFDFLNQDKSNTARYRNGSNSDHPSHYGAQSFHKSSLSVASHGDNSIDSLYTSPTGDTVEYVEIEVWERERYNILKGWGTKHVGPDKSPLGDYTGTFLVFYYVRFDG